MPFQPSRLLQRFLSTVLGGWVASQVLVLSAALPPANDAFTDAIPITGEAFTVGTDLAGATAEPFETGSLHGEGHTVWWRWIAPATGTYLWAAQNPANTTRGITVTVWHQDPLHQLSVLAHSFWRADWSNGNLLRLSADAEGSWVATQGEEYWINLDTALPGYPGGMVLPPDPIGDSFTARVVFQRVGEAPPDNDRFLSRIPLTGTNAVLGGRLTTATSEEGEPLAPGDAAGRTRWWTWTAPGRGTAHIRSVGTQGAPVVAIYRIGQRFALEPIANSGTLMGNTCYSLWRARDQVDWDTEEGTHYEIQVDRYAEAPAGVDYPLVLTFTPSPANDDFDQPQKLEGNDLNMLINNFGATRGADDARLPAGQRNGSIWFEWSATERGIVQISTNEPVRYAEPSFEIIPPGGSIYGSVSTRNNFFPGCSEPFADLNPLPPFTPVLGLFISSQNGPSTLWSLDTYGTNVIGAEVYPGPKRIYVDSLAGISGETRLHLLFTPPPANDAFTNRITLPSAPVKVSGRTFAATWDPNHIYVSRGAWWEWTAPSSGLWTLRPAQWDGTLLLETALISTMSDAGGFPSNATSTSGAPIAFRAEAGQRFAVLASTIDGGFGGNVSFAIDQAIAPAVIGQLEFEPWASRMSWHIRWPGNDGLAKVVETSTDLIHWGPLPANATVVEGDASLPFVDSESERFFRVRIAEPQ